MKEIVNDFAKALQTIDKSRIPFKNFHPGVGPYGEPQVVRKSLEYLKTKYPDK